MAKIRFPSGKKFEPKNRPLFKRGGCVSEHSLLLRTASQGCGSVSDPKKQTGSGFVYGKVPVSTKER